jgi:hypothetical protein
MFRVTWFEEYLLDVVHPEGRRMTRQILEDPKATFVWGKLMSPHFIKKLLGHSLPFCPAEIQGYARVPSGDFYALKKKKGATTHGVVLLDCQKGCHWLNYMNRFRMSWNAALGEHGDP